MPRQTGAGSPPRSHRTAAACMHCRSGIAGLTANPAASPSPEGFVSAPTAKHAALRSMHSRRAHLRSPNLRCVMPSRLSTTSSTVSGGTCPYSSIAATRRSHATAARPVSRPTGRSSHSRKPRTSRARTSPSLSALGPVPPPAPAAAASSALRPVVPAAATASCSSTRSVLVRRARLAEAKFRCRPAITAARRCPPSPLSGWSTPAAPESPSAGPSLRSHSSANAATAGKFPG